MASARAIEAGRAVLRVVAVEDGVKAVLEGVTAELQRTAANIRNIGLSLTAAGLGGVAAFLPAIKQAANAEEVFSKFAVVFGDAQGAVRAWGKELSTQIGRSEVDIASFAASFQDLLVPVGLNQGPAREVSKELTQLAFDLASFNNQTDADSVRDLQSALTGSSETMKKYGVVVNEAAVKQELLNQNLDPRRATEVEKVMARIAVIFDQTSAAQGDAIRTAGSYVNQMKALGGAIKDTAASLGESFLPAATAFASAAGSAVRIVGTIATAVPGLGAAMGVAAGGVAALGGAITGMGLILASLLSPVNLAILSIKLLDTTTKSFLGVSILAKARTLGLAGAMRLLAAAATKAGLAMRFAVSNPIVLGITAITVALGALAVAYSGATSEVERFNNTAGTTVTAAAAIASGMADELQRLSEEFVLSDDEQRHANSLLNELGETYNTFGIAVDGATGRLVAQAGAFDKLRDAIAGYAREQGKARIQEEATRLSELEDRLKREIADAPEDGPGAGAAQAVINYLAGEIADAEKRLAELRSNLANLPSENSFQIAGEERQRNEKRENFEQQQAEAAIDAEIRARLRGRDLELALLAERRKRDIQAAEEIGASQLDIEKKYAAERSRINRTFAEQEIQDAVSFEKRIRNQAIEAEIRASQEGRDRELALLEEQKKRELEAAEEIGASKADIERKYAAERELINKEFDERDQAEADSVAKKAAKSRDAEARAALNRIRSQFVTGTLATRVAGQQFGADRATQEYQKNSLSSLRGIEGELRKIGRNRGGLRAI